MATYKLDRLLHLTHAPGDPDAKAVEADDPEGHYVLGGAGAEIPEADAKRYGLVKGDGHASEAKAEAAPPENKAVDMAPKAKRGVTFNRAEK